MHARRVPRARTGPRPARIRGRLVRRIGAAATASIAAEMRTVDISQVPRAAPNLTLQPLTTRLASSTNL